MKENTLIFLILFLVDFVFTLGACALFLRRCYLLNRMANQRTQHYTTSFIIKSSLLCLFALSSLVELILSQTDLDFWLSDFP